MISVHDFDAGQPAPERVRRRAASSWQSVKAEHARAPFPLLKPKKPAPEDAPNGRPDRGPEKERGRGETRTRTNNQS